MATYRWAQAADAEGVGRLLESLELMRPATATERFVVAHEGERLVGMAHVERAGEALFVSSVGVDEAFQGRGIGAGLMRHIHSSHEREIYLYTIIPQFFTRLGFTAVEPPAFLPERKIFGCDACLPRSCVCMVKKAP